MIVRNVALASAALTLAALGAPAQANVGEVTVQLQVTVTFPTKSLTPTDRQFVDGMRTEIQGKAKNGAGTKELASAAAQRTASYERYPVLLGRSAEPTAADVNVSFSLTIKVDVQKVEPQDARFLSNLEREASQKMATGISEEALRTFINEQMSQYAAQLKSSGTAAPSWGDQPNVTVGISITIKF